MTEEKIEVPKLLPYPLRAIRDGRLCLTHGKKGVFRIISRVKADSGKVIVTLRDPLTNVESRIDDTYVCYPMRLKKFENGGHNARQEDQIEEARSGGSEVKEVRRREAQDRKARQAKLQDREQEIRARAGKADKGKGAAAVAQARRARKGKD